MKRFVTNIGVYFLALTVFCLSVGFNVTKLTCNEITTITLGDNSLSCSSEKIANCEDQTFAESCCVVENLVECCSTSSSCLCGKELSSLKYDFLTFLSEENDVEKTIFFDYLVFRSFSYNYYKHLNKFAVHPPPPKSRQLRLAEIQSFLI
jgi:hypothetical protein